MGGIRKLVFSLCVMAFALSACGGAGAGVSTSVSGASTSVSAATAAPAATKASAATTAPAATAEPAATTTAAQAPGNAHDAILAAFRKQLTVGPYRSKTTITSSKSTMEIVGEVVPPDRMHVTSTRNGKVSEQIYIGGKGWSRIGAGAWTVQNSSLVTTMLQAATGGTLGDYENIISDAKAAGTDTVDGAKALVYTYISDMNKASTPIDVKTNSKIWINEATGLIVKNEIVGTFSGITSTTVQTVEYDPSITIEPPK